MILTVPNSNFAFSIVGTKDWLIEASLLDHGTDGALAVWAVIGGVLTQLQGGLIGYETEAKFKIYITRLSDSCGSSITFDSMITNKIRTR